MDHKVKHEMTIALNDDVKNVVSYLRDIARGIEQFGKVVDKALQMISTAIVCGFIVAVRAELALLALWLVRPHTIEFWVPVGVVGVVLLMIAICCWFDQRDRS